MIATLLKMPVTCSRKSGSFAEEYKNDSVIYTMGSGVLTELLTWKVYVFLWKCSGLIQAAFIQESISTVHLRSQMQTVRL